VLAETGVQCAAETEREDRLKQPNHLRLLRARLGLSHRFFRRCFRTSRQIPLKTLALSARPALRSLNPGKTTY
jgi:hypothetical protein